LLAAALELQQQLQQPDTSDLLTAAMIDSAPLPVPVDYSETVYDPGFAALAAAKEAADAGVTGDAAAAGSSGSNGGSSEEEAGSEAGSQAEEDLESPEAAAMLAKHQLPSAKDVESIATHSNETKKSAREVSDGSLKLYLCIMLQENPVVTMAVVTSVGGDKYFSAYMPELGME
jgi:hypothetical protein